MVFFQHGVLDLADGDGDQVAVHFDDRDVFLGSGIGGAGDEFGHLLAAADDGNAFIFGKSNDVSTVFADIEFHK